MSETDSIKDLMVEEDVNVDVGDSILVGPEGPQGIQGIQGPVGKSAYEVAVENGFTGTEEEWLASLKATLEPNSVGTDELKDSAVTPEKTNFAKRANRFNEDEFINGSPSTSKMDLTNTTSSNTISSLPIYCGDFQNYSVVLSPKIINNVNFFFYDINGNYISHTPNPSGSKKFIANFPENTEYLRVRFYVSDLSEKNRFLIVFTNEDDYIPTSFISYNELEIEDYKSNKNTEKINLNSYYIKNIIKNIIPLYKESENIEWIDGYFLHLDGNVVSNNGFSVTDYIEVIPGQKIKIDGSCEYSTRILACYDFLKNMISVYPSENQDTNTQLISEFTIPDNVRYIKLGKKNSLYTNLYFLDGYDFLTRYLKDNGIYNPLNNKKILFNGDSICYGHGYLGGYAKIIQELNPLSSITNIGQGGTRIAKQEGRSDSILERTMNKYNDYSDYDYIILQGGVNDAYNSTSIPLGELTRNYDDELDENTFSGALESLFKFAQSNWKGKKIGFIITFKVPSAGSRKDEVFYNYMQRAKEICEKWSVPYLNLFNNSMLNYYIDDIKNEYSVGDGLHPNENGYRLISSQINNWIKSL